MSLQVGEPAQGGEGVGLVRKAVRGLVAAEAVVAVEQAGCAKAVDAGPEIVGRVASLGRAHRGGPAPVVAAVERVRRQRTALAPDRGMEGRLHEATIPELKSKSIIT
jgi:hypothetical protein